MEQSVFKKSYGSEYFNVMFKSAENSEQARVLFSGLATGICLSTVLYGQEKADAYDNLTLAYRLRQNELLNK